MGDFAEITWVDDTTQVTAGRMNRIEAGVNDAAEHNKYDTLANRPAASAANKNWIWIDSTDDRNRAYYSDGATWQPIGAEQVWNDGVPRMMTVRLVSTANVVLANTITAVDGVNLSNGDRVLLAGQSTAAEKGIWEWQSSTSKFGQRSKDLNESADFTVGHVIDVREGTVGAATQWRLDTANPTVGSTAIVITRLLEKDVNCTSSTRPASPLVGTSIFETDTLRTRVWDGSAWRLMAGKPLALLLSHSVDFNLNVNNWTMLPWDTETRKTDTAMHSTSSNNQRLIAPEAGFYAINVYLRSEGSAVGTWEPWFFKNAAGTPSGGAVVGAGTGEVPGSQSLNGFLLIELAANDYIEIGVWATGGGKSGNTGENAPRAQMIWMGPV